MKDSTAIKILIQHAKNTGAAASSRGDEGVIEAVEHLEPKLPLIEAMERIGADLQKLMSEGPL